MSAHDADQAVAQAWQDFVRAQDALTLALARRAMARQSEAERQRLAWERAAEVTGPVDTYVERAEAAVDGDPHNDVAAGVAPAQVPER